MLNAVADIKKQVTLPYTPAKIILMPVPYRNSENEGNGKNKKEETVEEKKRMNCTITFCEPVFKPKKHEFL